MPLKSFGRCTTKKCKEKVIGENIKELYKNGTKKRERNQIIAIAYAAAKRKK